LLSTIYNTIYIGTLNTAPPLSPRKERHSAVLCLIILSAALSIIFPVVAHSVEITRNTQEIPLGKHLVYFEDIDSQYSIEHIRQPEFQKHFIVSNENVLNFGHSDATYWLRFELTCPPQPGLNNNAKEQEWILELAFATLEVVTLYEQHQPHDTLIKRAIGYKNAISTREIPHNNFIFPLTLKPGDSNVYYMEVSRKGGTVQIPLTLYSARYFLTQDASAQYITGIFYGCIFAMILYNFFLMLSIGGRAYLYYILYIGGLAGTFLAMSGFGFLYLWPEHPEVNQRSAQLLSTFSVTMGLFFVRHFIKVKRYTVIGNQILSVLALVGGAIFTSIVIIPTFHSIANVLYANIVSLIIPAVTFYCWRKGSRPAGFFLVAWSMLFIGVISYTLSLMGAIPSNAFTTYGIQIGATIEVILLSLGLADRINWERKQKFQALQNQHNATLRLKKSEDRLLYRALHSSSTSLPNRAYLKRSLEQYIDNNEPKKRFGLFLISLNNFHEFNQTLGYANGNEILTLLTSRLSAEAKEIKNVIVIEKTENITQCIANAEGTTFALAVPLKSEFDAVNYAGRVVQAVEYPFEFQQMTLEIESSVGIAVFPDHGTNVDELLRNAQIALDITHSSNEKAVMYSPSIDPYSAKRLSLIGELRQAIENDSLALHFQPQIDLQTQTLIGAEVLIRWTHSEHGFIPPDEFIPLAERTGVIHPLTYWICRNAFQALNQLLEDNIDLTLSINISACNLQDSGFKDNVMSLSNIYKIPSENVILELTETAVMINPDEAMRIIQALSNEGIKLSIDDFGTGYSSMSYLKQLPVKELKIDRSFVMDMVTNKDDETIVTTILQMGHNLGLEVVAEGIEDEPTLALLTDLGCDIAQGYFIARPMPFDAFIEWIADNKDRYPTRSKSQATSVKAHHNALP